jgi:hypothetical protein
LGTLGAGKSFPDGANSRTGYDRDELKMGIGGNRGNGEEITDLRIQTSKRRDRKELRSAS